MRSRAYEQSPSARLTCAFVAAILVLFASCGSDTIRRDNLKRWRTKHFEEIGITIEAPRGAFEFSGLPLLQLHLRPSSGIGDGTYFLTISMDRMTKTEFNDRGEPSPENPLASSEEYMRWIRWMNTYHSDVDMFDRGEGTRHYRRDVDLGNGEIASLHAEYNYRPFNLGDRAEDDVAIRRILESARAGRS